MTDNITQAERDEAALSGISNALQDACAAPEDTLARIEAILASLSGPAQDPAAREHELERTVELLLAYGEARFGDEWWPGNARHWIPDGRELEYLLDPGSAGLADQHQAGTTEGESPS